MNRIRQACRNVWMNYFIIGAFVLWSGMFVCLLPDIASHQKMHLKDASAPTALEWHSDCLDGKVQTFCKSDGRTGVLGNLSFFASVDSGLIYRFANIVPFAPAILNKAKSPELPLVSIFLVVCAFLK